MTKSYQILAPAGSVEQLKMAVNNGCDAVYLGLDRFNARMKAENFTLDNLSQWVDFCHLYGVKVYVAINISLKNTEFQQAVETLYGVYFRNADGVILTDLALIRIATTFPKPFEIVASTQLNAHDKEGATFLKNLGADTIVCARECSYDDIRQIASTGVNVESFIHGALCVCQSGQCLFSSMVGGNSGNRGLCAQPCRKKYLVNGEWRYFLSPRDMYGLDVAKRLCESGASVFKIEGRNRRPEYAGATSRVYSQAFANSFTYTQEDKNLLAEMYNRGGLTNLSYLDGHNDNLIYSSTQNHLGVVVGKVKGKGFVSSVEITKGDGLKVFNNGAEVCGGIAASSGSGFVTAEFSGRVADGMTVCRTTSVSLCDQIARAERKLEAQLEFTAFVGSRAKIVAKHNDIQVEIESDSVVQRAQNQPISCDQIAQQLQKTGNSCYTITSIVSKIDDIFLTKGQINALRRDVLDKLTCKIVGEYNGKLNRQKTDLPCDFSSPLHVSNQPDVQNAIAIICDNARQVNDVSADYIVYKPEHLNEQTLGALQRFCYLDLPSFANLTYLKQILPPNIGVVCHNVGHVQFARENNLRYVAGGGLNIFNDHMAELFADADTFVYSHELTFAEISAFKNQSGLTFVDGQLTLMKVVHCPYKAVFNCTCQACKCDGRLQYKDELGNIFDILRRRDNRCTFEIVNGNKLSVANKLTRGGRFIIDYDKAVFNHYVNLNNGIVDGYVESSPYTKGRLFSKIN